MSKTTTPPPKTELIGIRVDPEAIAILRSVAREERRGYGQQLSIIIREWVAAREKKERK